jgi:hypothetical protein
MRIPMYAKNGLAPAIIDQLPKADSIAKADSKTNTPLTSSPAGGTTATNTTTTNAAGAVIGDGGNPVAFRVKGDFNPSMFPVIVDDKGNVQLDMSKLYDPTKGQFPKILQTGKDLMKDLGIQKGVDVIDMIQDKSTGYLQVANSKKAVNWVKVGNTLGKVGKILLSLIL